MGFHLSLGEGKVISGEFKWNSGRAGSKEPMTCWFGGGLGVGLDSCKRVIVLKVRIHFRMMRDNIIGTSGVLLLFFLELCAHSLSNSIRLWL